MQQLTKFQFQSYRLYLHVVSLPINMVMCIIFIEFQILFANVQWYIAELFMDQNFKW